jgi:ankyrin repeat protein
MFIPQEIFDKILLEFADNETIIKTRPLQSMYVRKRTEQFDVYDSLESGNTKNAMWLLNNRHCDNLLQVSSWAAKFGNLEVLNWILHKNITPNNDVLVYAAMNGHLNIVKVTLDYFKQNDIAILTNPMDFAAMTGHLDIVKYLHTTQIKSSRLILGCTKNAMDIASLNGHLDVVKYLHTNRTEGCSEYAMDWAASKGHIDILVYLHEHVKADCTTFAFEWACENGHFETIQWLYNHKQSIVSLPILHRGLHYAKLYEHLEIANWIKLQIG